MSKQDAKVGHKEQVNIVLTNKDGKKRTGDNLIDRLFSRLL